MPEFKVVLIISNDDNKEVPYSLNLTGTYEDYPEDYFRVEANRIKMQAALQEEAERKVDSFHLKPIIDKWIGEIKEGKRRTTIRLNLPAEAPEPIPDPPMKKSTPADIVTSEYKITIPNNTTTSTSTSTSEFRQTASATTSTLEKSFHPKTQIQTNISNSVSPKPQEPEKQPPKPKPEEKKNTEIWSDGNRFDDF
jgi:hypothetical protein